MKNSKLIRQLGCFFFVIDDDVGIQAVQIYSRGILI